MTKISILSKQMSAQEHTFIACYWLQTSLSLMNCSGWVDLGKWCKSEISTSIMSYGSGNVEDEDGRYGWRNKSQPQYHQYHQSLCSQASYSTTEYPFMEMNCMVIRGFVLIYPLTSWTMALWKGFSSKVSADKGRKWQLLSS